MFTSASEYGNRNNLGFDPSKIRLVIADDHPVVREGLATLLVESHSGIEIVGQANSGRQLIQVVKTVRPDVVLTDIKMPGCTGIEAVSEIKKLDETIRCIVLSQYDNEQLIMDAVRAGALGFLIKTAHKREIIEAILSVYEFRPYYCYFSATKLNRLTAGNINNDNSQNPSLTEKELEIIKLICEEKSSREIGAQLFLSSRTVEGHKARIMAKTGAKTTVGIVVYAILHGIYKLPDKE